MDRLSTLLAQPPRVGQKTFVAPALEAVDALEELEYIFYVKVQDFTQFDKLTPIYQEQWSVFLTNSGTAGVDQAVNASVRVRNEDNEKYTLANKVFVPGAIGKWELEREVDQSHFDLIKELATEGMIKHRYEVPIPRTDLKFEIDVHQNLRGDKIDWVRIELEVPSELDRIPELPIQGVDQILRQKSRMTPEEKEFVEILYDKHYVLKPKQA